MDLHHALELGKAAATDLMIFFPRLAVARIVTQARTTMTRPGAGSSGCASIFEQMGGGISRVSRATDAAHRKQIGAGFSSGESGVYPRSLR